MKLPSMFGPLRETTYCPGNWPPNDMDDVVQNIRRGHYELGAEEVANLRVLAAFDQLVLAL